MEDLVQLMWNRFLQVADTMLDALEKGVDYPRLQAELREQLDAVGRDLLRMVIEAANEFLCKNPSERRGWAIEKHNQEKEMLTPFGPVRYSRTYFKHQATGSYAHLADRMMGFTPHQRVDGVLKAELVERAAEQSYERSGKWTEVASWRVSRQTVMKAVRSLDVSVGEQPRAHGELRRVRYVFIQADEDHVPNQKGPRWQPRLVTVHEGSDGSPQRRRLVNAKRFGGLYGRGEIEKLYEQVWQYLQATYDVEHVQAILVSGDGAAWIRGLCEYLPGAAFVLDRFHARKYVLKATGSENDLYHELWEALTEADRSRMRAVLAKAMACAETPSRQEGVKEALRYFESCWDGVQAWKRYEGIWPGCSAEGDVSHVYAERLSSRPKAWGRVGVDHMSRLRVWRANGVSIKQAYLEQHSRGLPPVRVAETFLREARTRLGTHRDVAAMLPGNMPALYGSHWSLRRALRSLIDQHRLATAG